MRRLLNSKDRTKHVYLSGKTRHGKSTLLHTLIYQDMRNGEGLCVIDAKGDLIPSLLHWVPGYRKQDVILLDLDHPIPMDFMACRDQKERTTLVSDIIQIFKRLDEGWGVRMEALLRYVIHTLLAYGSPTFFDIYRILADEGFRKTIVKSPQVQSQEVLRNFWATQFDRLGKDASTPIIVSRMADFLLSPALTVILGTRNAELNIDQAMNDGKILLVNLHGTTDEAMVYGSLLVSKIQQAIFRRAGKEKGKPFMLYVDEFQNFKTSAFEKILSMAGGLNLGLTLANQYFDQLDPETRGAILNNVSTFFLFRMGTENAAQLKGELRYFPRTPHDGLTIRERNDAIATLKRHLTLYRNALTQWERDHKGDPSYAIERIATSEKELAYHEGIIEDHAPGIASKYIDQLPNLPVGQCIYHAADGSTTRIKTPAPPPHTSQVGKTSYAQAIKAHTLAQYGTKRPVDNGTGHPAQVLHTEGNDYHPKAEKPEPQAGPRIPFDES